MVQHKEISFQKNEVKDLSNLIHLLKKEVNGELLRWSINKVTSDSIVVEATVIKDEMPVKKEDVDKHYFPGKQVLVNLIPTGIGCSIGGFAADAAPAINLLASQVDYMITNPNAVNASNFINIRNNILYTEGYLIDRFMLGETNLYPVTQNKVGVIIEHTTSDNLDVVFNILNAVRSIYGVDIGAYYITKEKIGSICQKTNSGAYVGNIKNSRVLYEACEYLLSKGCNAIAVTTNVENLPTADYASHFKGDHPNPVGGVEAIISHAIVRKYNVACAHAPMINFKEMNLDTTIVDARGAGEMASESGMASVLIGLSKAPSPVEIAGKMKDVVNIKNVIAIVSPASSLGSIPVLNSLKLGIPVIAVKNNSTILNVTKQALDIDNIIEVNNYFEASGIVQALKEGISLEAVTRPLKTLRHDKYVLQSEHAQEMYSLH